MGSAAALMWPAILGMTFAILPEDKAGLAGGIILGAAGLGNAIGPADRRRAHRRPQLALDLLPQRADLGLRRLRHLLAGQVSEPDAGEPGSTTPGSRRSRSASSRCCRPRPGRRLGLGDPRVIAPAGAARPLIVAFVPIERRAGRHALVPAR
jgi:hypothetical protein